ncbi:hypothetical protein BD414DRAFT_495799 [Trametes punicea]|nr:hypothetical protein BD414DRAFT_495799 [Trametes punicea]
MMQFFAALLLALIGVVSAMPSYSSSSQCATGSMRCCNQVQQASHESIIPLLGALNLGSLDPNTNVGTDCTPIDTSTVGGAQSCTQMPVCCDGNDFGGLSIGCSPIPLTL